MAPCYHAVDVHGAFAQRGYASIDRFRIGDNFYELWDTGLYPMQVRAADANGHMIADLVEDALASAKQPPRGLASFICP